MNDLAITNNLKDKSNPRSLVNISPASISTALMAIPESMFEMSDHELRQLGRVSDLEEELRVSFWIEFDQAQKRGKMMNLANVYEGVCSAAHFHKHVVGNSYRLCYILNMPKNFQIQTQSLLNQAFLQMTDILNRPHLDKDGKTDSRLAKVKVEIFNTLLDRVHGSVPFRSENLNLNYEKKDSDQTQAKLAELTPDQIEKRIQELREATGEVIDVTETSEPQTTTR